MVVGCGCLCFFWGTVLNGSPLYVSGARGFPSGQRGGTQDPVAQASEGSNPSPRTFYGVCWWELEGIYFLISGSCVYAPLIATKCFLLILV